MGNLGRYQDIVTEAKLAGGVDALITIIEDTAVADRAPGIFGKGVGAGLLVACVVGGGAHTARFLRIRKRDRRALRDEAQAQLKAEVEGEAAPDGSDDDRSTEPIPEAGNRRDSRGSSTPPAPLRNTDD